MRNRRYVSAGALLALAVIFAVGAPGGAQTPAPYVHVLVDGQPVAFDVPPQIDNGRVLVPLRGVFERLGATVAWDDRTQTVLAQRGATGVSLVIGNTQAMVNGRPEIIDVPPLVVAGRTMVPLRFISQALGATVNWDAASTTVTVISGSGALPPSRTYAPGPAVQHVVGTLVAVRLPVDPGSPGLIVVSHNGVISRYVVTGSTVITRTNTANGGGGSVALGALRPGDTVDLLISPNNTAQRIRATYSQ
ncbi:MAG TPA: copper amine oxidase N-terminal domain-containing protein [bacterium]|nr:copper amine oxidase N-terminal domain-containing protein [bacterium]